jgi:hypothetical protein
MNNCKKNGGYEFTNQIAWQIDRLENFVYILNINNGNWFILNDISKDIWLLIAENKNIDEIVNTLSTEYETEFNTIYNDIVEYISELQEEGLVHSYV